MNTMKNIKNILLILAIIAIALICGCGGHTPYVNEDTKPPPAAN